MKIVHNGYYIELPNTRKGYSPLNTCWRLLVFLKDYELYRKHATNADHFHLVNEMLYHNCFDDREIIDIFQWIVPSKGNQYGGLDGLDDRDINDMKTRRLPYTEKIADAIMIDGLNKGIEFLHHGRILTFDSVQELNVKNSIVKDADIKKFHNLRKLNVSGNKNITLSFLSKKHGDHVSLFDSITDLNVACTGVTNKSLSRLRALQRLNVTGNEKITLRFLYRKSRKHPTSSEHPLANTLIELDAGKSGVTDKALQHLQVLQRLNARDNMKITLSFLIDKTDRFANTLTDLDASRSGIRDAGLQHLHVLRRLDAYGNENITLSFLNAKSEGIVDTLTDMVASYSGIRDVGLQHLRALQKLNASHTKNITLSFITPEHPLTVTLIDLNAASSGITDTGLCNLRVLQKLNARLTRNITLSFATLNHPIVITLTDLDASSSRITDDGLQYLRILRRLIAGGNEEITLYFLDSDSSGECIPFVDTLIELDASNSGITDSELQHLRVLQKLNASHNRNNTLSFLSKIDLSGDLVDIPFVNTLIELNAERSGITDNGLKHLRALQMLIATDTKNIKLSFIKSSPMIDTLTYVEADGSGILDSTMKLLKLMD